MTQDMSDPALVLSAKQDATGPATSSAFCTWNPGQQTPPPHRVYVDMLHRTFAAAGAVLATSGGNTVKLWDIGAGGAEKASAPVDGTAALQALTWNYDGSFLVGATKEAAVFFMDPASGQVYSFIGFCCYSSCCQIRRNSLCESGDACYIVIIVFVDDSL